MKKLFFLVFLGAIPLFAEERADFLILGNPGVYAILNKFEQPLSVSEKESFPLYAPLQILSNEATLGDQITSAAKCRYDYAVYYLLLDEQGNYQGGKGDPNRRLFKGCLVVNDTVEIVKNKAVSISQDYSAKGGKAFLDKGAVVIRLFKYQNGYYVRQTGEKARCGWLSSVSSDAVQKRIGAVKREEAGFEPESVRRIEARFSAANDVYAQYFAYFNGLTKQQKSVPRWQCRVEKDMILCVLSVPAGSAKQLEESTRYLVQDVENLLLGKPFSVRYAHGTIQISLRN